MAGVGSGVGHDERGAALRLQRGGKEIDPKIIRVGNGFLARVGFLDLGFIARDAVGVKAPVFLHATDADFIHVERWIGEHVVERAEAAEVIVVVGDALLISPRRPFTARFILARLTVSCVFSRP